MVKKLFYALLLVSLIAIIPAVFAEDTPITVTTYPNHTVTINVLDPSSGDAYAVLTNKSDESGSVTLTFVSGGRKEIDLYFLIRKDGKIILSQKDSGSYVTGNAISFDLRTPEPAPTPAPTPAPVVENTTVAENTSDSAPQEEIIDDSVSVEETQNNASAEAKVTGSAISSGLKNLSKSIYYIIGGVILAGLVVLLILKRNSLGSLVPKRSSNTYYPSARVELNDKELLAAETRIKQVEEQINNMKARNQKKVDAQRKFEEAKRELDKIKSEEEKGYR